uniref:Large ribosomal subunit protein bL32c n=1 Tax=Storeatula sp. CCMP1868 TaxID=195070 RepID=A0A222AHM4_9CRYP|nr:ribosomal protein L32 [Storeatula sp. CCMP1868]
MAVPKKRTSKMKKRSRKSIWINKSNIQAQRAISLAKSLATNGETSFVYSQSNIDSSDN